ncbi:MAG: tRNA (adenosine(37)-N6)-dimethylallyltransferase MiaA, partial [Halioglobus sp.]|nr:tRNA (adenosine(37)-N6)-dimethylallyltransferase MiaA [Halioglobus sp.]
PHHLIDIRDPLDAYSAADFLADATRVMAEITARGNIPLLVGGTMLYFKVLLEGLSKMPEANPEIRDQIQQQADTEGWPAIYKRLQEVDPVTAAGLHPNHSQRIQRALEVYLVTGVPMSTLRLEENIGGISEKYAIKQLALMPVNRKLIHQRIEDRFKWMMNQGFEAEVRGLYARGDLHSELPAIRSVGYRQIWQYLDGQCSLDEAVEKAITATRQLAKRQITWLRNWPGSCEIETDSETEFFSIDRMLPLALKKLTDAPIYVKNMDD